MVVWIHTEVNYTSQEMVKTLNILIFLSVTEYHEWEFNLDHPVHQELN